MKPIGTLQVSTPRLEYTLKCISPKKFRREEQICQSDLKTWELKVPVDLTFRVPYSILEENRKFPSIKSIRDSVLL